jgi:hypothetical protein
MNMKKGMIIFIVLFIVGCGATTSVKKEQAPYTPTMKLDATFTIENFNVSQSFNKWSAIIFFNMENTGNVQIGYYEVYFTVTCEDESVHEAIGWGPYESLDEAYAGKVGRPIYPGNSSHGMAGTEKFESKPISVKVKTWKLYESKKE